MNYATKLRLVTFNDEEVTIEVDTVQTLGLSKYSPKSGSAHFFTGGLINTFQIVYKDGRSVHFPRNAQNDAQIIEHIFLHLLPEIQARG